MFRTKNRAGIRVNRLTVMEAIHSEEGHRVKVRATLEADLTEKELGKLPQVAKAAKALLKSSTERAEDEGPDSVNMTLKFRFETLRYSINDLTSDGEHQQLVNFKLDGSVINRPRVSVVKGAVALRWVIECTIDLEELGALASLVQDEDGFTMSTVAIQLTLPLDHEKAA